VEPYRDLPLVSVRTLLPWRNTCGQGLPPQQKGLIEHRALQLILPFEPALPDRRLILAQRLWPTMPPRARQRLAKRLAHLLRSVLIAADARELSGGPQDEHAVQFAKSTNDGSSRQATLHLRAAVDRRLVRQHQESAAKRTATSVSGHQAEPTHRVLPNLTASSWRHSHISERMLRSRDIDDPHQQCWLRCLPDRL